MQKKRRWLAAVAVFALVGAALAGCGSGSTGQTGSSQTEAPKAPGQSPSSTPAQGSAASGQAQAQTPTPGSAAQDPTKGSTQPAAPASKKGVSLTVWTIFNDAEAAAIQKIADQWSAQTGNKVTVETMTGGFQEFAVAAQAGKGPDMMIGEPHDLLGSFWKAGLLAEMPDGVLDKSQFVPQTIDAVSFQGKQLAFPIAMECVGLFYNTSLVSTPPSDWDSFINTARDKGFMYNISSPYFSYGFISGNGGYVFRNTGGGLDVSDVGMNNAGAVQGMKLIDDLFHTYKTMPPDTDDEIAKGKFQAGKTAFWLTGSWEVQGLKDAGTPFAVAPMPTLPNGQPFKPFIGVQTGFVSSDSRHQAEAWDLAKFFVSQMDDFTVNVSHRIPVTKAGQQRSDVKGNPILNAFAKSAENGTPMPNVPEMTVVWPPFAQAMQVIANGQLSPQAAADAMEDQIKKAIADMK